MEEDEDSMLEQRYHTLCLDLNMDKHTKEEAWESFETISQNYSLEGDALHWLACALYVACRKSVYPTVRGGGTIQGNCVSVTRLIRSAKLSLMQFFNKMKKWADMTNLPASLRQKIEKLERNFSVSTVIFKKFKPLFLEMFKFPVEEKEVKTKRKQNRFRGKPCSINDLFNFCWTLFIQVKGNFPALSDDLVNSYNLLLCCMDYIYGNVLQDRKDLLNPAFDACPRDADHKPFGDKDQETSRLEWICKQRDGIVSEAKSIREHYFKMYLKGLFERKILKGDAITLGGILDANSYEHNSKELNRRYEEYVLGYGDFDERVFLNEDAQQEIGSPSKIFLPLVGEDDERIAVKKNLQNNFENGFVPQTPLTGRKYLENRASELGYEAEHKTPVSTATQSVTRLLGLIQGLGTGPSEELKTLVSSCGDPQLEKEVMSRVSNIGKAFCDKFSQEGGDSLVDFAQRRLVIAEKLYFKFLQKMLSQEKKRLGDLVPLLQHELYHKCLFACCLEIVLFSYNSQRTFPWIIDALEIMPYQFYKVIELVIRIEEGLSREVVKHLNFVEESILESMAWKSDSPLWEALAAEENRVPLCEEVSLPSQLAAGDIRSLASPDRARHPQVEKLATSLPRPGVLPAEEMNSPSTAADRFQSPLTAKTRRQLFSDGSMVEPLGTQSKMMVQYTVPRLVTTTPTTSSNKPKKTGSVALFFRKVYNLAAVRLRDLGSRLDIDDFMLKRIWTCFEHALVSHIDLMKDRHIDQLMMCSIYVMSKVTSRQPLQFQEIIKYYRLQPQARNHVYRSVLISKLEAVTIKAEPTNGHEPSEEPAPIKRDRPTRRSARKKVAPKDDNESSAFLRPSIGSQPPTPTKLSGTGSTTYESEERGDLIKFYNAVFVPKVKDFVMKFSNVKNGLSTPPLSPLPSFRSVTLSPRRISSNHSIYISPSKNITQKLTPASRLLYCFQRSPSRDLRAINNLMQRENRRMGGAIKRIIMNEEDMEPKMKQIRTISGGSRLASVMNERKSATVAKSNLSSDDVDMADPNGESNGIE